MIPFKKRGPSNPITDEEIARIKELQLTNSISEISRILKRPPSTVTRIVKAKKLGPQPKIEQTMFDWKDFDYSMI